MMTANYPAAWPRPFDQTCRTCGRSDEIAQCGGCHGAWCDRCDPAHGPLCPWCHGRGYSTAPVWPQADRVMVDCGHYVTPGHFYANGVPMTTGYARAADTDARMCYSCADDMQRTELATADRFTGYLSADGRSVTTWTGGTLARVTEHWTSRAAHKTYVRAVTPDGARWHGQGPAESGTYVNLRRCKS